MNLTNHLWTLGVVSGRVYHRMFQSFCHVILKVVYGASVQKVFECLVFAVPLILCFVSSGLVTEWTF